MAQFFSDKTLPGRLFIPWTRQFMQIMACIAMSVLLWRFCLEGMRVNNTLYYFRKCNWHSTKQRELSLPLYNLKFALDIPTTWKMWLIPHKASKSELNVFICTPDVLRVPIYQAVDISILVTIHQKSNCSTSI